MRRKVSMKILFSEMETEINLKKHNKNRGAGGSCKQLFGKQNLNIYTGFSATFDFRSWILDLE